MTPDSPLTQLLDAYLAKHMRNGAGSTVKQYHVTLGNMEKFIGHSPRLSDLSDDLVQDFMAWFISRGRTPRGANKLRSNIHTLWSFACRNGWLSKWPDSKALKEPRRIVNAWTPEQLRQLHEALTALSGDVAGIPEDLWWVTLHAVIWDTAERIGAVRQLTWNDVSLDQRRVTFRAETRKNKTEDKQHPLHPETVAFLGRLKEHGHRLVFPWDREDSYLWIRYKAIRRKAGLPCDRIHSFHCMRKSSASYFEAAGWNATTLLGHSSRAVTEKHYLDLSIVEGDKPSPCDVLPRLAVAEIPEKTAAGTN
ncbi:MAG: tyrosine-type recombinase/integrase, partial [Planctomycetaceae bacterium]|nr:tyrosine-type recombinase/integrase [Planctomycetaceae bacterium]